MRLKGVLIHQGNCALRYCYVSHFTHILQAASVAAQSDCSLVSSQTQFKGPVYL